MPVYEVKILCHDGEEFAPRREKQGDAGYDLRSVASGTLYSGEVKVLDCGFSMELPEDIEAQIRPRSGMAAKHGVTVLNSPGTIDSGYRGPVKAILINHSKKAFAFTRGDRIAQMVFNRVEHPEVSLVTALSSSERGEGGFGHTGS